MNRTYISYLCFGLLLPLGCGPTEQSVGWGEGAREQGEVSGSGITSGRRTDGYPSVGYVESGDWGCTGTLINKRAVLTSAHCIVSEKGTFYEYVNGTYLNWSQKYLHHGFTTADRRTHDLAVLILDIETSLPSSPLNVSPVSEGQAITLVGLGDTISGGGGNDNWDKTVGTNQIRSFNEYMFSYKGESNLGDGDSGGPSFVGQAVVGVHSAGNWLEGYDVRVDTHIDWIRDKAGNVRTVGTPSGGGDTGGGGDSSPCVDSPTCASILPGSSLCKNNPQIASACCATCKKKVGRRR